MNEFDYNVNEVIASFMSDRVDSIIDSAKASAKKISNSVRLRFRSEYEGYLKRVAEENGKTKTFFIRNNPKPLYDFYVPIDLRYSEKVISAKSLKKLLTINKRLIIVGTGGAGKSILLKHLLLTAIREKTKIPVLVELRKIPIEEFNSFDSFLSKYLKERGLKVDSDYLEKSLNKGHYLFLFDGLDEIDSRHRRDLMGSLNSMSNLYSECDFVITSRPEDYLSEFGNFSILDTEPLSLKLSVSLVEKLPADNTLKSKFIFDLKNGMFEQHKTFLSNPLLLSIMLLTYEYSADIPGKLSIFYNQAYEALFQRHDAYKGAYKRVRKSDLDIMSFEKVLSAFCLLTYDSNRPSFSLIEALDNIEKCKSITGLEFNSQHFLDDMLQAVCFLVEDGLFLTFTHRSFQEFFTAKFIANADPETKRGLLNKFKRNIRSDRVYKLVSELDQEFMEKEIFIPNLREFLTGLGIKKTVGITHYVRYMKKHFEGIEIVDQSSVILIGDPSNDIQDSALRYLALENNGFGRNNYPYKDAIVPKKYLSRYNKAKRNEPNGSHSSKAGRYKNHDNMIKVSSLKTTQDFTKFLFNCGSWYSKRYLDLVLETYVSLLDKHKERRDNIMNLIQN